MAGRKYKKRDKKAEFERRPRKPSPDWEERKLRIRQAYGVKFPERTVVAVDTVFISKTNMRFGIDGFTTPCPNEIGTEHP